MSVGKRPLAVDSGPEAVALAWVVALVAVAEVVGVAASEEADGNHRMCWRNALARRRLCMKRHAVYTRMRSPLSECRCLAGPSHSKTPRQLPR